MFEAIREIVRSSLTGVGFLALTVVIVYKTVFEGLSFQDIPQWYSTMVSMMVAWWFRGQVGNNHS
ncbi:MAG: hypothetical protein AABY07_05975 [Nanoarchaeota archaeon]